MSFREAERRRDSCRSDNNMSKEAPVNGVDGPGLHERNTSQRAPTAEIAKKTVVHLNAEGYHCDKNVKDRKTFGRTPDGVGELPMCSCSAYCMLLFDERRQPVRPTSFCFSNGI